jgi:hypothetical protein
VIPCRAIFVCYGLLFMVDALSRVWMHWRVLACDKLEVHHVLACNKLEVHLVLACDKLFACTCKFILMLYEVYFVVQSSNLVYLQI